MKQFFSLQHFFAISCIYSVTLLSLPKNTDNMAMPFPASSAETVSSKRFVKVYPDASKKIMFVEARETRGSKIDFFVFDLDGTLMKHFKMKTGDREKISGLEKGKYVYSVFSGDEEADHGEFDIH